MELEATAKVKRHRFLVDLGIRLVKEKPLGSVGGAVVLVMLLTGIFANLLAPYGMNEIDLATCLRPPSAEHLLGTDQLGRDLLSRIIYGARISMIVGVAAASLNIFIATILGIVSGFWGGTVDITVQRFVDAVMSFPYLLLVLTIMALLQPGLWQVILVLGVTGGIGSSRIVRSAVIAMRENMYVQAAAATGCSDLTAVFRHILPNVAAPVIIIFTLSMGGAILAEATISFLGFGIPPPQPTWGGMLSLEGRQYMLSGPWLALWPGAALIMAVYGINMMGDALRDLLDPRLRGGLGQYGVKKKKGVGKVHA